MGDDPVAAVLDVRGREAVEATLADLAVDRDACRAGRAGQGHRIRLRDMSAIGPDRRRR